MKCCDSCQWLDKEYKKLWRNTHSYSQQLLCDIRQCEWKYIGGCSDGRLDVAHINQNPFDNRIMNLKKLCRAHHSLMDRGVINPTTPKMPKFYIDKSGKRRYYFKLLRDMENRTKRNGWHIYKDGWTIKGHKLK